MASTHTAVGRNVRAEMARHLPSQADVAKVLGVSPAAVGARLRGETEFKISELQAIADHLHIALATLIGRIDG